MSTRARRASKTTTALPARPARLEPAHPSSGTRLSSARTTAAKLICGGNTEERCATSKKSTCSEATYRNCETDQDCEKFSAGFCNVEAKPCFESRITRTGRPSPLGTYCFSEDKACTTNADCTQPDDFCVPDAARPETVALFCMPATAQAGVNSSSGITGPVALRLNTFVRICRCGDGIIGCDEQCDDSNLATGDGCDDLCQQE